MTLFLISLLAGVLIVLGFQILFDNILGDRGKDGQIKSHFYELKGESINLKNPETHRGILDDLAEENKNKYRNMSFIAALLGFGFGLLITRMNSIPISLLFSLIGLFVPRALRIRDRDKKSDMIATQFRDALHAIKSSLRAGLSMNSAITKCPDDLEKIHQNYEDKLILREFIKMKNDLNTGVSLDQVLLNFRDRMQLEEIGDFVNSIIILKKKGGNLVETMDNTISMISDKMALKAEVKVLTASKKMEANILNIFPFGLLILLSLFGGKYMQPLYSHYLGNIVLIIGFGLIVINYFVGKKITDITA